MRALLSFVLSFSLSLLTPARQTPTSSTQGQAVLQKALAALVPSTSITDVTLSGTARRIAGPDDETGTVIIRALVGTGSRIDLTFPSGSRSEIRNTASAPIVGSWSGPDGVAHAIVYHNLLTDPSWIPALTIAAFTSAPNALITYVGTETKNGQQVIHVSASLQPPVAADTTGLPQHLSRSEIYLDSSTLLPTAITFSAHPDNNASLDIPVEIGFSSYEAISGSQIPFHIQRFLNNSLALDLQFTSATLNSGIPASTFNLQ